MRKSAASSLAALTLAVSCRGMQSALDPAGAEAERIASLWWILFWVSVIVFTLVVVFMLVAVFRNRAKRADMVLDVRDGDLATARGRLIDPDPERERRIGVTVAILGVITAITLIGLLIASVMTGHAISTHTQADRLLVKITAKQWWWEVQYVDPDPSKIVTTANEMHIPVGRLVELKMQSNDVIHSFWVPNLNGKRDIIPSHTTTTWLRAKKAGVYRGQCAEFCGLQHAHMALLVVADPPEKYSAWLANQRRPANPPTTPAQIDGERVFLSGPCPMCHNIQGTTATGQVAPDLTHLASRATLAAGTMPNGPGSLAAWITDPQQVKPGNHMPPIPLEPQQLQSLIAYLGNLK